MSVDGGKTVRRLRDEIATLEKRLEQIGPDRDCGYEKALIRFFRINASAGAGDAAGSGGGRASARPSGTVSSGPCIPLRNSAAIDAMM